MVGVTGFRCLIDQFFAVITCDRHIRLLFGFRRVAVALEALVFGDMFLVGTNKLFAESVGKFA